jgi:flagellin-like protein
MKYFPTFTKNNRALSPVIGEILLIAIVVVLGAIIASYAFGSSETITKLYLVGATVDQPDSEHIVVTFTGGKDDDKILYVNVSVNGFFYDKSTNNWSTSEVNTFGGDGINPIKAGRSEILTDDDDTYIRSEKDHVIVTGHFIDGTVQIILDGFV